jgi:acylglycerol lipase
MPWYQRLALDAAVRTLPWLKLTGEGIRISPSDHIEMLQAMGKDPLVIKATRVDALWGITDLMDRAQAAAGHLQTPALLLYGEQDEIIPKNAFCRFLAKLPGTDPGLTFVLYEQGMAHAAARPPRGTRTRRHRRLARGSGGTRCRRAKPHRRTARERARFAARRRRLR